MSERRRMMIANALDPLKVPLTFTAEEAGATVALNVYGTCTIPGMHYRMGKSGLWLPYTAGTAIELPNIGDSVQFWNNASTLSTSQSNYAQFAFSNAGGITASGNAMSLLNWSATVPAWGFAYLLRYTALLTSLPLFPSTQVGVAGYYCMCQGCVSLVNQKVSLPSPIIPNAGYYAAFMDSSITEADIDGSTGMGDGYNSLSACFSNCTSLKVIRVKFTRWYKDSASGDSYFAGWVKNVSATGTFYKPSALPEEYGVSRIPEGWTVVNID
jgi:hypothetical protein